MRLVLTKRQCDGEFPCKRCKDDGVVCTSGVRKRVDRKQLPEGYATFSICVHFLSCFLLIGTRCKYAEVLENKQVALSGTIHKVYSMVRNLQPWTSGEPELNDRGQPVIHNITQKLGCIRTTNDIDLLVYSVFPEDDDRAAELGRQFKGAAEPVAGPAVPAATSTSIPAPAGPTLWRVAVLVVPRIPDGDPVAELHFAIHCRLLPLFRMAAVAWFNLVVPDTHRTPLADLFRLQCYHKHS